MVKAKLATLTEKWINGKTEKQLAVKMERQHNIKAEKQKTAIEKMKQTFYISKETSKMLWHNRAETGEPISHTIEKLVKEHFGKK